jgi:hypothetical protein
MTTTNSVFRQPESLIEQVLELSADAQIKRRETLPASITFHNLTGAILAYAKLLHLLTSTKQGRAGDDYLVIEPLHAAAAGGPL